MECKKEFGRLVIPVFYNVDPSHVRYQLRSYSEPFKKHLQNNKKAEVQKWREAFTAAANLEGLDSHSYRDEIEFIQNIVKDILQKLIDHYPPNDSKSLVGISENLEKEKFWKKTGKSVFVENRVSKQRNFIVLDDVSSLEQLDYLVQKLQWCGAAIGMRSLLDRALIAISHNCVRMHDLIQELGWDIVCQQSSGNLENRSHLWDSNDIRNVLGNNKGTDSIESIVFDMSQIADLQLNADTFKKMPKLRFLKLYIPSESDGRLYKL
ncbi:hypothetical protein HN51_028053 [Arachis hypogaea]